MSQTVLQLAQWLAGRLHAIDISSHAGIFGSDVADLALLKLRKTSADLVLAANQKKGIEPAIGQLEAALRSAQLVSLLSKSELDEYMKIIDELYLQTDKET